MSACDPTISWPIQSPQVREIECPMRQSLEADLEHTNQRMLEVLKLYRQAHDLARELQHENANLKSTLAINKLLVDSAIKHVEAALNQLHPLGSRCEKQA